jgi:Leu/Phe-tRNA-protein transferase
MIMEKQTFINFLNSKFDEQKLTSMKFYGYIKLVKDENDSLFLYISAFDQEFLISITKENELVTRIDVETVNQRKFQVIDIIFSSENTEDNNIVKNTKITGYGYIMIEKDDNLDKIMDNIIEIKYQKEHCIAYSLAPEFISGLMFAGFIIMTSYDFIDDKYSLIVKPAHHKLRSVLKYEDLHIKRTIKRFLNDYELKFDSDFETIVNKCHTIHRSTWLTKPLIETIFRIKDERIGKIQPVSFGVYKNGELKAGEFGIISGKIYTSYSGYYEENNAGNVQMILTAKYLNDHDFKIYDFGMPLKYKEKLGAKNIKLSKYLKIFRKYRT